MSTAATRIAGQRWELEARPERGGRITSLRLDGEELLDQGIGVDQPTANGFVAGGAFGWDEMVPNLEPTDTLPDHGEAWRLPWTVLRSAGLELAMRCRGQLRSWELTRSIYLRDGAVFAAYTYRNVGRDPIAAYWCSHCLFRYRPDLIVSIDIPRPEDGRSAKIFLPPGSIDQVRLGRVRIRWDAALTPDVAIWVCNGDLGGYRQIAVEPATASPVLAPGKSLRWWLAIEPV